MAPTGKTMANNTPPIIAARMIDVAVSAGGSSINRRPLIYQNYDHIIVYKAGVIVQCTWYK